MRINVWNFFKRVFGSEESKDILMTFLNCFIGNGEITDLNFLNTEQLGKQKFFKERSLYYSSYPITRQGADAKERYIGEHGNTAGFRWNLQLKPVWFIAVLNFRMKHEDDWDEEEYYSSYSTKQRRKGNKKALVKKP